MTEKEKLEIQSAKYKRIKNCISQSGWQDILKIIESKYSEMLEILKSPKYSKQELEARGVIKFIDELMEEINSEIDFGKVIQEKYVKKYINQIPKEG